MPVSELGVGDDVGLGDGGGDGADDDVDLK